MLQPSEAGIVAEQLVLCLGLRWDAADWEALGSSIGHFKWAAFLAVLEAKYCGEQQLHTAALVEAVDEIYDVFIEDIIKKVFINPWSSNSKPKNYDQRGGHNVTELLGLYGNDMPVSSRFSSIV